MNKVQSSRTKRVLKHRGHLLVGYLLAGYPSREGFLNALSSIVNTGVDIVEIGFPSRNPVNDGEAIQEAHMQVDMSILDDLAYWQKIRQTVDVPLWIMGYNEELVDNPRYLQLAKSGSADGFVLPALSNAGRQQLNEELAKEGCDVLGFVNAQMPIDVIHAVFSKHSIVYLQLYVGKTGTKVIHDDFEDILKLAQDFPNVSVFAGFGIDTRERVQHLLHKGFDGVIVGTAFIKKQNESLDALVRYAKHLKLGAFQERTQ